MKHIACAKNGGLHWEYWAKANCWRLRTHISQPGQPVRVRTILVREASRSERGQYEKRTTWIGDMMGKTQIPGDSMRGKFHHSGVMVEDDEISLIDLLRVVWRYKTYIFSFVALSFFGVSIYLFMTPDVYKAEAVIMPLQGRNTIALPSNLLGLEGLKEMIGENMPGMVEAPNSSKIRALLTGRRLNLILVEKFDLLPILFAGQWDKSKQRWYGTENNRYIDAVAHSIKKLFGVNHSFMAHPSPLDGAELLQTKISVTNTKNANTLKIEFEDNDPNFTVSMINRYIEALDEYLRSEAITRANDSKSYINVLLQAQSNDKVTKRFEELLLAFSEQELYAKMKSSFLFEVVDPPILPEKPFKPKRLLILALAFLASLMMGVLLSFVVESIKVARNKIKNGVEQK